MFALLGRRTWFDGYFRVLFLIKLSVHICRQLSGFQGIAHAAHLKYGTWLAWLNVFLAHWHGCIFLGQMLQTWLTQSPNHPAPHPPTCSRKPTDFAQHIELGLCIIYLCVPLASISIVFELSNQWQPKGAGREEMGLLAGAQWLTMGSAQTNRRGSHPSGSISALNGWLTRPDGSCKTN